MVLHVRAKLSNEKSRLTQFSGPRYFSLSLNGIREQNQIQKYVAFFCDKNPWPIKSSILYAFTFEECHSYDANQRYYQEILYLDVENANGLNFIYSKTIKVHP